MKGKTCLVTGGAGGLGRAMSVALKRQGAEVIVADLPGASPPEDCKKIDVDLSSQAAIRAMIANFRARYDRLDLLFNNAGAIFPKRIETVDGLEMTFSLNHLSHFTITLGLLDVLKRSTPSLIVNVASSHHRAGRMDFDDLQGSRRYSMNKAYCQSKLANVMFTHELVQRLEGSGVTAIAVHPGAMASGFGDSLSGFWHLMWRMSAPLRQNPDYAAKWIAELVGSSDIAKHNGDYFTRRGVETASSLSRDLRASARLWSLSLELAGLEDTD